MFALFITALNLVHELAVSRGRKLNKDLTKLMYQFCSAEVGKSLSKVYPSLEKEQSRRHDLTTDSAFIRSSGAKM